MGTPFGTDVFRMESHSASVTRARVLPDVQLTAFTAGEGLLLFAGPKYRSLSGEGDGDEGEVLVLERKSGKMYSFRTPTVIYSMGILNGTLWVLGRAPWTAGGSPVARVELPAELHQASRCDSKPTNARSS